jgi:small subunit ribosomal protein S16
VATRIRLQRAGKKKSPLYRVVVADSRAPRDGRFIDLVGRYNPRTEPSTIELDIEKIDSWLSKGAQPSETVTKLIAIAKGEKEAPAKEAAPSKKAVAKAAAEAAAAEKAAEEAAAAKAAAEAAAAEEAAAPAEEAAADEASADEPAEAEAEADAEAAE